MSYRAMFAEAYDLLFHLLKLNFNITVLRLVQFRGLLFTFKMQLFLRETTFQLLNFTDQVLSIKSSISIRLRNREQ
jgi:hypothetical protein